MSRTFSEEFKLEAVGIAQTNGLTRKQVADDLGVGFSTLSRWIQQANKSNGTDTCDADLHAELSRLRQENNILRQERDILKKARGRSQSGQPNH